MILVLFYAEHLKDFVIETLRASDHFLTAPRIKHLKKDLPKKAWQILVDEKIITPEESAEIQKLIDYRNDIGHRIHFLTCDIGTKRWNRDFKDFQKSLNKEYNYEAAKRLKSLYEKVSDGFRHGFITSLSFDQLMFEETEKVLDDNLTTLRRKINRQFKQRKLQAEQGAAANP